MTNVLNKPIDVGYFPYKPGGNPYQYLFADGLRNKGVNVICIPPKKIFPLSRVSWANVDLLQLDWPHDWYQGRNFFAQNFKRMMYEIGLEALNKKRVVWTAHNLYSHNAIDIDYDKKMIQKLIDVCDGIIVMSCRAQEELEAVYKVRDKTTIKVIPHGHYIDAYPNIVSRSEARKALGLDGFERVLLNLGRILPYKGLEQLIESFKKIRDQEVALVIAGPCADKGYLEQLNSLALEKNGQSSRIIITPKFIHDEQLQYYFNASDIVALPFKRILNSGSLLLAMSFGKCVIAPDAGSISDIVHPDGWFGYSPENNEKLLDVLERALKTDLKELEEKEPIIIDYVKEKYSWSRNAEGIVDLYRSILKRECK